MQGDEIKNVSLLALNLSKGNLLAFNTLYRAYSNRLYRFAFGYLKSEAEAEELVQEVFTIIWERRGSLKTEHSFKSFLFTIAFNIIRKHFRTKIYLCEYFKKGNVTDVDMQTSLKVSYDSLYQYLTELVNKLPGRRKEIFIKSRFEGCSINEIAKELNISHKTVENQLSDALKYIRTNLKSEAISVLLYLFLFVQ
jgi:RNA polymerase sigma-70 factor (family 1)